MSKKSYQKMSRAERRVAIAKDAMDQIHAGRIVARHGDYIANRIGIPAVECYSLPPKQQCYACANGALFLAWFNLAGINWIVELDGAYTGGFKVCNMNDAFSRLQLRKIEAAFENSVDYDWIKFLPNPKDRLIAILQNIIDHKGTFKPEVMYEMV